MLTVLLREELLTSDFFLLVNICIFIKKKDISENVYFLYKNVTGVYKEYDILKR